MTWRAVLERRAVLTAAALESCVAGVAERLTRPDQVIAATTEPDPWIELGEDGRRPRWHPASLAGGPAGIALLFAELAYRDAAYRGVAHDYLVRAVAHAQPADGGLHSGLAGIALAARAAARSAGDYANLLGKLDEQIAVRAMQIIRDEQALRGPSYQGTSYQGTSFRATDVIGGLAGIGRYLLTREHPTEPLYEVLRYFVALTEPVSIGGVVRPGWWVRHAPTPGMPDEDGHVNFGVAHGIGGPLSLLALAWRAGHRVPGQDEAIGRIVTWYLAHLGRDEGNPFWPVSLSGVEYTRGLPPRRTVAPPTWCYGAPGIARAVQLAGLALEEPSWCGSVRSVVHTVIDWLGRELPLPETMLCHGWSGLLQMLWRINSELDDPVIARAIDDIAGRLLEAYDPDLPFGFRVRRMGDSVELDLPGFLEGAAGTALALHTRATGRGPDSGWDAALLLA